jgi:NADPH-dependent curcumin reductase CurA
VGQLAKAAGVPRVGFAGGAEKCDYVTGGPGRRRVDYKAHNDLPSLSAALRQAPQGIDGRFENVGGMGLDAVMQQANAFARVAMCGMIAGYNGVPIPMAAPQLILTNRMTVQGFIVSEHMELWPRALKELGERVANGTLRYRETITEGLERAPEALLGLLKGRNFGKQLVKLV